MRRRCAVAVAFLLAMAATTAGPVTPVLGAPPLNDDPDGATVISALPFTDSMDVSEATVGPADQYAWCTWGERTVYYEYTFNGPAKIAIDTYGSDFDTELAVMGVSPFGDLSVIGCGTQQMTVNTPDTYPTVLIMVNRQPWSSGGTNLVINVDSVPPPANDDFDAAIDMAELPYQQQIDPFLATRSADDPAPTCGGTWGPTIWYQATPGDFGVVMTGSAYDYQGVTAAVFTGARGELTEVACSAGYNFRLEWDAEDAVTYYVMLVSSPPRITPITFRFDTVLTVDVVVTRTVVSPRTGVATIEGLLVCSKPAWGGLSAQLRQAKGRYTLEAAGYAEGECTPDGTPWSISMQAASGPVVGPFVAGRAELDASAYAYGGSQSAVAYLESLVRLKGVH